MNKLILSVFMLLAVSKSNGQMLVTDTTSWGSIYWRESANPIYDTVPVIFQYSDTSCHGFCPVLVKNGYAVRRYDPSIQFSTTTNYANVLWRTTGYLLLDKKPIPATWVVWMALETRKPDQQ